MIQTGRNPFARETITKHQIEGKCSWCGNTNRRGKVWIYTVEPDTMAPGHGYDIKGKFCDIDCLNSYHC